MKLLLITILSSVAISAQTFPRKPLKVDSTKLPEIEKFFIVKPSDVTKIDSSIVNLYKMPVSKPKNPELYSSLKAAKRDTILQKIPNLLDRAKPPKLASK
ncbi:hypothetical protein OF897_12840 [Chryseobacterium formosus]|uniref:Uncharacterized protein n=1 Tax=Chryseobacterium formosus TaxID=1537363 RepID=A0ABT3XRP3_9FLAO|nr:hypothetical protein [Chryseobacterium formosus]MCX8524800.1 hypothetical protein [Chryseobacterium formosus]